jgi:hypothetical protein
MTFMLPPIEDEVFEDAKRRSAQAGMTYGHENPVDISWQANLRYSMVPMVETVTGSYFSNSISTNMTSPTGHVAARGAVHSIATTTTTAVGIRITRTESEKAEKQKHELHARILRLLIQHSRRAILDGCEGSTMIATNIALLEGELQDTLLKLETLAGGESTRRP